MRRACWTLLEHGRVAARGSLLGPLAEAPAESLASVVTCSARTSSWQQQQQHASFSTLPLLPARRHGARTAQHHSQQPFLPSLHRGLSVKTQSTPNPQSLMFLPSGHKLLESGSLLFTSPESAKAASPLASRLFDLEGVASVMFGTDFITVTKGSEDLAWSQLKHDVVAAIQEHFASGQPVLAAGQQVGDAPGADNAIQEDDNEIVAAIKELLETRIRPAVQEDGGDLLYRGFDPETGIVTVRMMGSCSGCPSSTVTLKSGVENMLMHYVPEVTGVEEEVTEVETESAKALARLEASLAEK